VYKLQIPTKGLDAKGKAHMKPEKMKAVLLTGFGGYDKLEFREDVVIPKPQKDEVLVKVSACGINNTDIWTREGAYGNLQDRQAVSGWRGGGIDFPRIQGADIVGYIADIGREVSSSRIGEHVLVNPTLYGRNKDDPPYTGFIGSEKDGGFAEFACVPTENAHRIDSPLSEDQLATFMCAYLTAEHMLNRARLKNAETILVTGASGGVGSALVQLAKLRRASVVAITAKGKERYLQELDVDAIVTRNEPDLPAAIRDTLGKTSIDVVADVVAGPLVSGLLDLLGHRGRYVTAGAISSPTVTVDWRKIYLKQLDVLGSTLGTQKEAADLIGYITRGRVKPLLACTYPLTQIVQAQKDFKNKQFFGKLVIAL
jgi:NADPH:quinone reductase-like Zn-dependent oxidoreductase